MWVIYSTLAVLMGLLLDFLFGDPNVWWHPICLIGRFISACEKFLRKNENTIDENRNSQGALRGALKRKGILLVLIVCTVSVSIPTVLLAAAYLIHPLAGFAFESVFCWFLLAGKCLRTESMKVAAALENDGLEAGRYAVSMIVGRDTDKLSKEGVIKAAVETVAENTSDGIVAPLIFMLIGGAPLGFLYKSINTMDSMVGYKNEKYIDFGWFAAKTDDVANYIPARISGIIMILAAYIGRGFSGRGAYEIFRRDRRKHASPNSANTESAMAGALGIQLAGNAVYFGKKYDKPYIGDALRNIEISDIDKSGKLMYLTSFFAACAGFALKGLVLLCMNMAGIFTII